MALEQQEQMNHTARQPAITYPPHKMPGFYAFLLTIARVFMRIVHPVQVNGRENLADKGGQMLICNHQRWTDALTVAVLHRRVTHYMGKSELFQVPVFSHLLGSLGAFPVRRGQADIGAIKQAIHLLKDGRVLCIFPEGTRNHDDSMREFQKGAAAIALKAKVPVVPIYIGKYRMFRPLQVWIGQPVDLTGLRSDAGTSLIRQAVLSLEEKAGQ